MPVTASGLHVATSTLAYGKLPVMPRKERRYVRQMPKIYGDLHKKPRIWGSTFRWVQRILWLAIVVAATYAIYGSGWFSVRRVEVIGASLSDPSAIEKAVPMGGSLWRLPAAAISAQILADRRIASVSVSRGLPDRVRVSVKERIPAMLWQSGAQIALLDVSGASFALYPAGQLDPATPQGKMVSSLPHVQDVAALPVTVGQQVASPSFIRFASAVQKELSHSLPELAVSNLEVTDTTYDLTAVAHSGLRVEFNTLGDAGVQVRNLARMVRQKDVALIGHQVDLRVDRWAFVTP